MKKEISSPPESVTADLLAACKLLVSWFNHPDIRFKMCDGGRGNLGEAGEYHKMMRAANEAIRKEEVPVQAPVIVIFVSGGVVQSVVSESPAQYILCDADNDEATDPEELIPVPENLSGYFHRKEMGKPELTMTDIDAELVPNLVKLIDPQLTEKGQP